MKKFNLALLCLLSLILYFIVFQMEPQAQYSTPNYVEQGGARHVIGGSIDIVAGGDLDVEDGGAFKLAGVVVTASAADLNSITGLGSTPGVAVASKAVVLSATLSIDNVTVTDNLNIYGSLLTSTGTELNYLDGVTPGSGVLSKAIVISSTGSIPGVTVTDTLNAAGTFIFSGSTFAVARYSGTPGAAYIEATVPGIDSDDEIWAQLNTVSGVGVTVYAIQPYAGTAYIELSSDPSAAISISIFSLQD